ncbi:MAG: hypothetical protein CBD21_00155 [bacterium TMED161]|nr:MAG: hypothetical protein CBD21_00155 [bacterium TMED161]
MKALILAAGKGTRLFPATKSTPKPLMPLAGKATLSYIIDEIVKSGISKIGLVVSEDNYNQISKFIKCNYSDLEINLIIQDKQLGVAHAVKISKDYIKDDDFILYLGDNLFENGINNLVKKFSNSKNNIISLKSVADPRKFGVAEIDAKERLIRITEKPKVPKSNFAVTGIYAFKNIIFDYIDRISISERGEYEITDVIKLLIKFDNVESMINKGWWIDTGNLNDYLMANKFKILELSNNENLNANKDFFHFENSKLIDSEIIKYSSIGKDVVIENSKIENCVILDQSKIRNYHLINCILSRNATLINDNIDIKILENKII